MIWALDVWYRVIDHGCWTELVSDGVLKLYQVLIHTTIIQLDDVDFMGNIRIWAWVNISTNFGALLSELKSQDLLWEGTEILNILAISCVKHHHMGGRGPKKYWNMEHHILNMIYHELFAIT